jgi:general secretion pathway protein C
MENPQPLARVLCISAALVCVIFELWSALSTQFGASAASHAHAGAAAHDAANVEQIAAADLFGHAANQNTKLPQTDLQVTLRAVFAAEDPKIASAVIETGDGRAQVVKIGGPVGSSATLQAVYSNRIVLSRNGALETLNFPPPETAAAQNTALSDSGNPADTASAPGASAEEIKRAAILQRLEELRARAPR